MNKSQLPKILVLITVSMLVLTNCNHTSLKHSIEYQQISEDEYPENYPCDVKFVKNIPEEENEYILIGICETKGSGDGDNNIAMKRLRICACDNGGNIVKMISHQEGKTKIKKFSSNQVSDIHFKVVSDKVIGEVYRYK